MWRVIQGAHPAKTWSICPLKLEGEERMERVAAADGVSEWCQRARRTA